ncbi:choice-of-anchor D domain-containing protein [Sandaracinobacteroides hominis]|uniref:choice-of-anchor D domain-containing protein n=1 Tax=Sandaracinobacteroides hominis TaxID=2780086 RepID=UPI0018F4CB9E|nr:choice-of-anchor D domain-containing protein [Sandaracinobacteroides hominis]
MTGAASYGGGGSKSQTGTGSTIHNGAVTLGSGSINLDGGRLLEFKGGVTTDSSNFTIYLNSGALAGTDTLRNAAGSTFLDQTSSYGQIIANSNTGLFENLGTYRKTGAGTTYVQTSFTNAGTVDIDAGTLNLSGDSTLSGTIDLASGAVLHFSGGTHSLNGPSLTGAAGGLLRVSSGTITVTGAVNLPTVQVQSGTLNATDAGAKLEALILNGGTFNFGGTDSILGFTQTGGTLSGAGVLTVTGAASYGGGGSKSQTGTGSTIHNGAVTLGSGSINLDGGRLLEFKGGVTTDSSNFTIYLNSGALAGTDTLRNAAGSTFLDQTSSYGQIIANSNTGLFENLGTYRKTGAGTTYVQTSFTNAGIVSVESGTLQINGALSGASGTMLSGGTWVVKSPGSGTALLDFETASGMTSLATSAADISLSGANSEIRSGSGNQLLEVTLATNASGGALRILNGRSYTVSANAGAFTNAGLLEVGGGSFNAASIANSGAIQGFGTVNAAITGAGGIRASGGTLSTGRFTGAGAVIVDAGATLDASAATGNLSAATLAHNGAGLALGTRNITITTDYSNAAFGAGNAFDARANVSGTGLILASSAGQSLSGEGLTSGQTANPFLDFGGLRAGESKTVTITITNTGTQTMLRGAVQGLNAPGVAVDGGQSFAILAGGTSTFNVTYVGSAGSLSGQSILVANNFANVANQTISLSGAVFRAAEASLSPTTINFGNVRMGSTPTSTVSIGNIALNDGFSEGLRVMGATASGAATAGSHSVGVIAAGAAGNATVGLSTTQAGAKSGSVSFALATDGEGTSGLGQQALSSQSVTIQGSVFAAANPTLPASIHVGNHRIGDVVSTSIQLTNSLVGGVPAGYQEGLDAAAAISGNFGGSGAVSNLAAGSSSMIVATLNTATAGAKSGTASFSFATNGSGTSGLATESLGNGSVTLTGGVFALANPTLLADLDFGNVQQGTVQTRTISVSNLLIGGVSAAFQEGLNASFGTVSGGFSGSGSVTNLAAGGVNSYSLIVTLDTTLAGAKAGQVQVVLASNGATTSGLGIVDLTPQFLEATASVQGGVYRLAEATVVPMTIDMGNRRVGDAAPAAVTITVSNSAIDDGYSEKLNGSIGSTSGRATASGSFTLLDAQASSTAIQVGINTSTAGANGSVTIALASNGEGTSGAGLTPLSSKTVALGGGVYRLADHDVDGPTSTIVARVGDATSTSVTVRNTAIADGYSEGLGITSSTETAGVSFGSVDGLLAAGGTRVVTATIDTTSAGTKSGTIGFEFTSDGTGTSGFAALGIGSESVTVQAQVYAAAQAAVTPTTLDFGTVRVGEAVSSKVIAISNVASGAFADSLVTGVGTAPEGFSVGSGPDALAAGASGEVVVSLDSSAAGQWSGVVDLGFVSRNPVLADLALDGQSVAVTATVNNHAAPVFTYSGTALTYDAGLGGYVYDFGTLSEGSSVSLAGFGLGNLVFGPADDLSGLVGDGLGGVFSLGSAFDIGLLQAGDVSDPFTIFVRTSTEGFFSGQLTFAGLGTNASDHIGEARTAKLFLSAKVVGGTPPPPPGAIPEPSSWLMMIMGFGAVGVGIRVRRRKMERDRLDA